MSTQLQDIGLLGEEKKGNFQNGGMRNSLDPLSKKQP